MPENSVLKNLKVCGVLNPNLASVVDYTIVDPCSICGSLKGRWLFLCLLIFTVSKQVIITLSNLSVQHRKMRITLMNSVEPTESRLLKNFTTKIIKDLPRGLPTFLFPSIWFWGGLDPPIFEILPPLKVRDGHLDFWIRARASYPLTRFASENDTNFNQYVTKHIILTPCK